MLVILTKINQVFVSINNLFQQTILKQSYQQFRNIERLNVTAVNSYFDIKKPSFYVKRVAKLPDIWANVIDYEGDYVPE